MTPPPDDSRLFEATQLRFVLPVVAFAKEIGIFDRLAASPGTIEDLANEFEAEPRAVEVIMAVLAGADFLRPDGHGSYDLTETARVYLVRSSPFYRTNLCLEDQPLFGQLSTAFRARSSRQASR